MKNPSKFSFANLPENPINTSKFDRDRRHSTTCVYDYLIPIFLDEVLPGDVFKVSATMVAKLLALKTQVLDDSQMEIQFFYERNRNLWDNWKKFQGEQVDPGDSIDYMIPQIEINQQPLPNNLAGYFGIPKNVGHITVTPGVNGSVNSLPFKMYYKIWNEHYRHQDLQDSLEYTTTDALSYSSNFVLQKRGKFKDYFTMCLPNPQKTEDEVTLPIGSTAPVFGNGICVGLTEGTAEDDEVFGLGNFGVSGAGLGAFDDLAGDAAGTDWYGDVPDGDTAMGVITKEQIAYHGLDDEDTGMYVDLSSAVASTVNDLREKVQLQRFYERDARCGTRYHELLRAHWDVIIEDTSRSVYLGSVKGTMGVKPVVQTSQSDTTPQGTLTGNGIGVISDQFAFENSFDDYGFIMGLLSIRGDISYQQGLHRMWRKIDRFDYPYPEFAHLGEQEVLNSEIYCGADTLNEDVFGYIGRYDEYRYGQSLKTGELNSEYGTIDEWHLSQDFGTRPVLNDEFIESDTPVERVSDAGSSYLVIIDTLFRVDNTRKLPTYNVPGMMDHF